MSQVQVQRQILAPLMQQSISILLLPLLELNQTIDQELQNNPLLEVTDDRETTVRLQRDQAIREDLTRLESAYQTPTHHLTDDDEAPESRILANETTLEEHLLRQLRIEVSDPLHLQIGEFIIGNLDFNGYLTVTVEEIAANLDLTDTAPIETVLFIIQNFDPIGIAARNLQECLLIQLKSRHYNGTVVTRIVCEFLYDLAKKRFLEIARQLNISVEELKIITHVISQLDPKPARSFQPHNSTVYVKPDVYVTKDENGEYHVTLNHEGIPHLRISPLYQNMLKRDDLTDSEKDFIRDKLENAVHFLKSIEQRGHTVREITKYILKKQREFFDGNHLAIAPMTLKDVADAVSRNESTISRAISNKYLDTPQGLFPMKYFFSQAISTDSTLLTSSQSIKQEIRDMVESENKSSPLSDQDIQSHFERKGIRLARRTITKYREHLQIPASYLRKN